MIWTMISKLLLGSSLIALNFSCFTVNILKNLHVIAVAREERRLGPLNAIPKIKLAPVANAAIETLLVVTEDVCRPASSAAVNVFFSSSLSAFH